MLQSYKVRRSQDELPGVDSYIGGISADSYGEFPSELWRLRIIRQSINSLYQLGWEVGISANLSEEDYDDALWTNVDFMEGYEDGLSIGLANKYICDTELRWKSCTVIAHDGWQSEKQKLEQELAKEQALKQAQVDNEVYEESELKEIELTKNNIEEQLENINDDKSIETIEAIELDEIQVNELEDVYADTVIKDSETVYNQNYQNNPEYKETILTEETEESIVSSEGVKKIDFADKFKASMLALHEEKLPDDTIGIEDYPLTPNLSSTVEPSDCINSTSDSAVDRSLLPDEAFKEILDTVEAQVAFSVAEEEKDLIDVVSEVNLDESMEEKASNDTLEGYQEKSLYIDLSKDMELYNQWQFIDELEAYEEENKQSHLESVDKQADIDHKDKGIEESLIEEELNTVRGEFTDQDLVSYQEFSLQSTLSSEDSTGVYEDMQATNSDHDEIFSKPEDAATKVSNENTENHHTEKELGEDTYYPTQIGNHKETYIEVGRKDSYIADRIKDSKRHDDTIKQDSYENYTILIMIVLIIVVVVALLMR